MKGNEVDNRRRLEQLAPQADREREFAKWVGQDELEFTSDGELRTATKKQERTQLPNVGWE